MGCNIALARLPWAYCKEGRRLKVDYMGEILPFKGAAVRRKALFDPGNQRPRS